ncbi:MAG: hypothetical protein MMC33_000683 [Icmadophila ericetorum]|nr:hypothetical protein [Icmadophila ericetorum]
MTTAEPIASAVTGAPTRTLRQNHRWRGQRRGNKQKQENGQNPQSSSNGVQEAQIASLAIPSASTAPLPQPSSTEPSSTENSAAENGSPARPQAHRRGGLTRGGGGPRRSRNEAQTQTPERGQNEAMGGNDPRPTQHPIHGRVLHGSGRQFGGRLTSTIEEGGPPQGNSTLHADAPEFRPGQLHEQRNVGNRRRRGGENTSKAPIAQPPRIRRGSMKYRGTQRSGPVRPAGPCFISLVSRNGQRMKVPLICNNETKAESFPNLGNGGVPVVIFQRMSYPLYMLAGVGKRSILVLYRACRLTHVVKRVESTVWDPSNALILVSFFAMLVLVPRVLTWVPLKAASVERRRQRGNVWIQTMIPDGAVKKSAETLCLVENTFVRGLAMKGSVVLVTFRSMRSATVANSVNQCHALIVAMSSRVERLHLVSKEELLKVGLAYLIVTRCATDPTTAKSIPASRHVTLKRLNPQIVHFPPIESPLVHAVRHGLQNCYENLGQHARILSQIVLRVV